MVTKHLPPQTRRSSRHESAPVETRYWPRTPTRCALLALGCNMPRKLSLPATVRTVLLSTLHYQAIGQGMQSVMLFLTKSKKTKQAASYNATRGSYSTFCGDRSHKHSLSAGHPSSALPFGSKRWERHTPNPRSKCFKTDAWESIRSEC